MRKRELNIHSIHFVDAEFSTPNWDRWITTDEHLNVDWIRLDHRSKKNRKSKKTKRQHSSRSAQGKKFYQSRKVIETDEGEGFI